MGMDLNVYTKELAPELIPKIQNRFLDFQMDVEFHPEFKFNEREEPILKNYKEQFHR